MQGMREGPWPTYSIYLSEHVGLQRRLWKGLAFQSLAPRDFITETEAGEVMLAGVRGGLVNDGEKAMAPHSSTLAWKIPWTEEPGRL